MARKKKGRLCFVKESCDPLRALFPRDEVSLGRVNLWSLLDWPGAHGLFADPQDHEAQRIYHRKAILNVEIAHHIWDRYLHYVRRPENPVIADQVSRRALDATAIFIEKEQRQLGIHVFDAKNPGYHRKWDEFVRKIGVSIWENRFYPPECASLPPNFDSNWDYRLKKLKKRQEGSRG